MTLRGAHIDNKGILSNANVSIVGDKILWDTYYEHDADYVPVKGDEFYFMVKEVSADFVKEELQKAIEYLDNMHAVYSNEDHVLRKTIMYDDETVCIGYVLDDKYIICIEDEDFAEFEKDICDGFEITERGIVVGKYWYPMREKWNMNQSVESFRDILQNTLSHF